MKKVIRGIEFFAARLLTAYANSLPEHVALRFGATLGAIARRLVGNRAMVARENARLCGVAFGSNARMNMFVLRCFQHIGVTVIEVLRQGSYRPSDFETKISVENPELLKRVMKLGRGAVLMSGHFGNWELLAALVRNLGYPVDLLVKRQSNRRVDELLNGFRKSQGLGIIHTDTGSRDLLRAVRGGGFVAILADQYGGAEAETAAFFGNDVLVPTGPAVLIQKYNLPLVFGVLRRAKNGKHHLKIKVLDDLSDLDRRAIVQRYTTLLEDSVRSAPEMWLWTHRKFKNLTDYGGTIG